MPGSSQDGSGVFARGGSFNTSSGGTFQSSSSFSGSRRSAVKSTDLSFFQPPALTEDQQKICFESLTLSGVVKNVLTSLSSSVAQLVGETLDCIDELKKLLAALNCLIENDLKSSTLVEEMVASHVQIKFTLKDLSKDSGVPSNLREMISEFLSQDDEVSSLSSSLSA